MKRLRSAISKLIFCAQISFDPLTFLKLNYNTKQFRWRQLKKKSPNTDPDREESYILKLNEQRLQVFMRTFSGDIAIFYEVFWHKVYELPAECFKSIETVVDLGANIGLSTLYFKYKCPDAKIYALEPEARNFDLLSKNTRSIIFNETITVVQAAIDVEDGLASVQVNKLSYNSSIVAADISKPEVRTISMKTLLKELNIDTIDILKIDIEGSEKRLFDSNTDWLHHIKYLVIEFHSPAIKAFCTKVLLSKNYSIYPLKAATGHCDLFWGKNNSFTEK